MNINIPTILDVAVGLVFVFFNLSIFVSGIVEFINTFLEQRAKLLRRALTKLLADGTDVKLANDFFNHKLNSIKEEKFWGFRKPINYLSADSFSTVLIDLLTREDSLPSSELTNPTKQTFDKIQQVLLQPGPHAIKELLRPILAKSDDFHTFRTELERWYNGYMEQVSGWFKRYAQGVVWLVSGIVAFALNVDTIYLVDRLFNDNGLRERVVAEAIKTTQDKGKLFGNDQEFVRFLTGYDSSLVEHDEVNKDVFILKAKLTGVDSLAVQAAYLRFVQNRITEFKLPIGWAFSSDMALPGDEPQKPTSWFQPGQHRGLAFLGWLLTAAALSFGAPFWFDLLLKLVNIRNTARRPPGNPDPR